MEILFWILQIVLVPAVAPLVIGVIRKLKAMFQSRRGASVFQPYLDIWKLLHKDEVVSRDASWIFRATPYIVFVVTIVAGASIPLFSSFLKNPLMGDALLLVYTLSIGTFFLVLAGMDTGSAFGGFGSSREATIAALAEGGFLFSIFTVVLVAKSGTNMFDSVSAVYFFDSGALFSMSLAFLGFLIVLLAETKRFPFDNPSTHLELTMIHEAMILEYSGKSLALMEWASANKLVLFIALATTMFFPFGLAQSATLLALFVSIGIFLLKILAFCVFIAVVESSIAKFRFFRLPDLLFVAFILNVIAIGLI